MKKSFKLTEEEVRHVAKLARLELTSAEVKKFQKQLGEILNYVSQLKKIDTRATFPTSQVTGLENIFREDRTEASLPVRSVLANSPDKEKNFFKIKAIFGK